MRERNWKQMAPMVSCLKLRRISDMRTCYHFYKLITSYQIVKLGVVCCGWMLSWWCDYWGWEAR